MTEKPQTQVEEKEMNNITSSHSVLPMVVENSLADARRNPKPDGTAVAGSGL